MRMSILAAASFLFVPVLAADQALTIPEGWQIHPYEYAAAPAKTVLILRPSPSSTHRTISRLMIVPLGGATPVFSDLPGRVFDVRISPNGEYVLTHQETPGMRRVSLVKTENGEVVWSKDGDERIFEFSGTGRFIVAHKDHGESVAGRDVEVFDLGGHSKRKFEFPEIVTSAVLPDDDMRLIVAIGERITSVPSSGGSKETWAVDLGARDGPKITFLEALGQKNVIVHRDLGNFIVMATDGSKRFTYDPEALGRGDPSRAALYYFSFYAHPLSERQLLLFREAAEPEDAAGVLVLDVRAGTLMPNVIDATVPTGFERIQSVLCGRMIFYSDKEVRIRALPF